MIPTSLFGPSRDPNFNQRMLRAIDGTTSFAFGAEECCPPNLCNIDPCGFICAFMEYMPRGPMWDFWKRYRAEQMRNLGDLCTLQSCQQNDMCLTVVDHAIYTAKKLLEVLQNPLQTAIWESNPLTAFNTRQYWLDTFGWEDCFEGPSHNKQLGFPTPYQAVCHDLVQIDPCLFNTTSSQMTPELDIPIPPLPCPTNLAENQLTPTPGFIGVDPLLDITAQVKALCPPDLLLAVQYGILRALVRLSVGVIPNFENINEVLSYVGAAMTISFNDSTPGCAQECNQMSPDFPECVMTNINDCNQMDASDWASDDSLHTIRNCRPYQPCMNINLSSTGTTLPAGPGITEPLRCETLKLPKTTVNSFYEFPGIQVLTVGPDCPSEITIGAGTIWPGTIAAACLLLSMIPSNVKYTLTIDYPTL